MKNQKLFLILVTLICFNSYGQNLVGGESYQMVKQGLNSYATNLGEHGNWYPIFFNNFDVQKLNDLIDKANKGCIKKSQLTYDQNEILKNQIVNYINNKTTEAKINLNIEREINVDTSETKYQHNQVIITVYSQKC